MGWGWGDDFKVMLGMGTAKNYTDVKKVIKNAEIILKMARQNPDFLAQVEAFRRETDKLSGKFKDILSAFDKAEKIYQAAGDAKKVKAALDALDGGNLISTDPKAAAYAIGVLFVGVGGLAKNLPKPGSTAGSVLVTVGGQFSKMYAAMDPLGNDKGIKLRELGEIDPNARLVP